MRSRFNPCQNRDSLYVGNTTTSEMNPPPKIKRRPGGGFQAVATPAAPATPPERLAAARVKIGKRQAMPRRAK